MKKWLQRYWRSPKEHWHWQSPNYLALSHVSLPGFCVKYQSMSISLESRMLMKRIQPRAKSRVSWVLHHRSRKPVFLFFLAIHGMFRLIIWIKRKLHFCTSNDFIKVCGDVVQWRYLPFLWWLTLKNRAGDFLVFTPALSNTTLW